MSIIMFAEEIGSTLKSVAAEICDQFSVIEREYYEREFQLLNDLVRISETIRSEPTAGDMRLRRCTKLIEGIDMQKYQGCYLPVKPEAVVVDIDRNSVRPMQSAAKAPYMAKFFIQERSCDEVERLGMESSSNEILHSNQDRCVTLPDMKDVTSQSIIFKFGDEVRQDALALQVIGIMKNTLQLGGLDLLLCPYRVVATDAGVSRTSYHVINCVHKYIHVCTYIDICIYICTYVCTRYSLFGFQCGVIECVPNARSCAEILHTTEEPLKRYFLSTYGATDEEPYKKVGSPCLFVILDQLAHNFRP